MNKINRWKPSKAAVEATKKADEAVYTTLVERCIEAVLRREKDILLKFPYFVKIAEDFPKGVIVDKTTEHNVYKAKVAKLLDWLYDNEHSPYSYTMIMKSSRQYAYNEKALEKLLTSDSEVCYSESKE